MFSSVRCAFQSVRSVSTLRRMPLQKAIVFCPAPYVQSFSGARDVSSRGLLRFWSFFSTPLRDSSSEHFQRQKLHTPTIWLLPFRGPRPKKLRRLHDLAMEHLKKNLKRLEQRTAQTVGRLESYFPIIVVMFFLGRLREWDEQVWTTNASDIVVRPAYATEHPQTMSHFLGQMLAIC